MNKQRTLQMLIAGAMATITLTEDLKPAHGPGLDGTTQVNSLKLGESDDHPGKTVVQDVEGNNMITTADELFVAAKAAGEKVGWRVTAVKI